ncbi:hypothetical protein, partial [Nonomuraea antimicrobica]|uniref:hypothetical protein n=1 Tax=Nonomuraea antimicrobica TaxID=561173 RepID=UPI0031ECEA1C
MRTRLSAALLLLLSWFLPVAAHAQAAAQVTRAQTVRQATWGPEQRHSGVREVPPPALSLRAWSGPSGATGAAVTLASGPPGFRHPWSVAAPEPSTRVPAARS